MPKTVTDDVLNVPSDSEEDSDSDIQDDEFNDSGSGDKETDASDENISDDEERAGNIGEDENDGDESSDSGDEGQAKDESVLKDESVQLISNFEGADISGDSSSDNDEDDGPNIGDDDGEENMREDDADESSDDDDGGGGNGNVGWADAMAKVLSVGKNSEKKVSILSKAKKDNAPKKVVTEKADGEVKEVVMEEKKPESLAVVRAKKKELDSIGRRVPDVKNRSTEKMLSKIATRGVVQLFNAVKDHQKSVKTQLTEAGKSFSKREKVYKNIDKDKFLDVLAGKTTNHAEPPAKKAKQEIVKKEEEDENGWNILRDDFMMGAKMRDWDKESDEEK